MVSDDDPVFNKASKLTICLDEDIQLENFQQKNILKSYFRKKGRWKGRN